MFVSKPMGSFNVCYWPHLHYDVLSVNGQRQEHEDFVMEYTEKLQKAENQVSVSLICSPFTLKTEHTFTDSETEFFWKAFI